MDATYEQFFQMIRVHTYVMEKLFAHYGISLGRSAALGTLDEYGPMPQKELTQRQYVSSATMSVMLGRMEKEGLVRREKLADNAKENMVYLTEKGTDYINRMNTVTSSMPEEVFAGISPEDMEAAVRIFSAIRENHLALLEKRLPLEDKEI